MSCRQKYWITLVNHELVNLQTMAKKVNIVLDQTFISLVLSQISAQLHRHHANITYAYKRSDVDLCDINLVPAIGTLQTLLDSLAKKVQLLESKLVQKKRKRHLDVLIPSAVLTALGFIMCVRCFKNIN
ncbi:unnamed protein product [Acanthoscelides obtectus]|uniref:Uncharacterized protein n=1 Tax=Acanthoscelides obtectus TaxID=200917 RepID=A0A9P0KTQ4_ACAOB|nr:unnamed protein product [Acanthoscelides obtectus]CAK1639223.1 hypothetical protein AOBTE_LOCUS11054 [Acanthoscelides obtectus]